MTAEVRYTPSHTTTPKQMGEQVERITRRLSGLADA